MEITKIWLTPTEIWVETADGRQACERFADYAGLRNASPSEREQYTLSPYGIHWEHLDEDLCFEGFTSRDGLGGFDEGIDGDACIAFTFLFRAVPLF